MGLTVDNDFENVTLLDVSGNLVEVKRGEVIGSEKAFLIQGGVVTGSNVVQPMRVSNDGSVVITGSVFQTNQPVTQSVKIDQSILMPVSVSNFPAVQVVTGTLSVVNALSGGAADPDIRFQSVAYPPSGSRDLDIFGKISVGSVGFPGVEVTQGIYIEQTINGQRSINSTNNNDTAAGSGARQVRITYYDSSMNGPFFETITLNGTSAVNTVNNNICFVETIDVISAGSTLDNTGTIRLYTGLNATGTIFCTITPNENTTQILHHYVRPGWTSYIYGLTTSFNPDNANQGGYVYLAKYNPLVTTSPRTPITAGVWMTGVTSASGTDYFQNVPIRIDGPARIVGYVTSRASTRIYLANMYLIERRTNE